MKKITTIKSIAIISLLTVLISSCKKYETEPLNIITSDLVFDERDVNGVLAKQVINNIYTFIPNGFNRIDAVVLDAGSDDAISSTITHSIDILSKGRLTPESNPDDRWSTSYQAIRRINDYLSKEYQIPNTLLFQPTASPAVLEKQYWRAEVRFIRALNYFELIKRYGGVPLIGNKVFGANEIINTPRNTFDECVSYIVTECDNIKDSLLKEPLAATNWGRIPRGAAMALKAKALLYAASPLNNPSNDIAKWQLAANASKDVMNLAYYQLEAQFTNAFLTRTSREIILAFQRGQTSDLEQQNSPIGYNIQPVVAGGYVSPTQELVDSFPMRTGVSIYAAGSGYNPATPYANRDLRLDATIFYNGISWLGRPVETFEGGKDKPGGTPRQTRTGYYMKKFLGNFATGTAYTNQTHNFPVFRYADVLLMYAEAINEAGNQAEAYIQLRALRQRAGITAGAGNIFGLPNGMTQAQMRVAIQRERRIEMAFEEQRIYDIRRWKIAETMNAKEVKGMKAEKSGTTITYTPFTVDRFYFNSSKHYLYPIPFSEITANKGLVQNAGY